MMSQSSGVVCKFVIIGGAPAVNIACGDELLRWVATDCGAGGHWQGHGQSQTGSIA